MRNIILTLFVLLFATCFANAQTSVFTYQGKLTDTSAAANGQYDFSFKLYDSISNGTQIGTDVFLDNVQVSGGIFTVNLNFGATAFSNGAARFLEITVRTGASTGAFTTLAPRQQMTSSPFAIKSLNATTAETSTNSLQLGGAAANQFVQTTDSRLSDDRNPLPNSPNYIQNTASLRPGSFNLIGSGAVSGTLTATEYNIGPKRVLAVFDTNLFVGRDTGVIPLTGLNNSFFGTSAGEFFVTGSNNSFFGNQAGQGTTNVNNNSFFGKNAGQGNGGGSNSFFGMDAGTNPSSGNFNTLVGFSSQVSVMPLSNATAIGARAFVTTSNSLILGSINNVNGATADTNVGIGTTAPQDRLDVGGIIRVSTLGSAGSTALCRNASNQISTCSSSLRYKQNVSSFGSGLNLITRLSPITFDWKTGGLKDLGLGAEDVAAIEPLLVTYNDKGEVEGVKYDRLGVVLINAVKEQQKQIEQQQQTINQQNEFIKKQQAELDALKSFVCSQNPAAEFCQPKK